jgi:DNA-binding response OmpR family regulator/HPt (histidine-containing phosphotransfer) domain-containing protein
VNPGKNMSRTLEQTLDETRQRFIATFVAQCDSLRILVEKVAALGPRGPVEALMQMAHRLSGLAGTIGFPTVGARAAELEDLVDGAGSGPFDAVRARDLVDAVREAFTRDLAIPPAWALPAMSTAQAVRILVAEDESDQRAIVTTCLERAGYVPIVVGSGDRVVTMARAEKPALILLDIAMPRLDGYSACRLLKGDPELADIPVIFMTTGANLDDKLAGLALGADEFLTKPVDLRELVLRIQLLLARSHSRRSPIADEPPGPRELTYDAFLAVASEEIGRSPAALAVVSLPPERHQECSRLLTGEIRGRDAIGACGPTRLLVLMPEMTAVAARDRLEPVVDRLVALGVGGICVGVTAAEGAGSKTAEVLIGEADKALAGARCLGHKTAIWSDRPGRPAAAPAARTVVVAEDDPAVTRIVDAQVRAAGYQAIIALDGEQALAAVRAHTPDALVLDLMMPRLNGFDVLTQLRERPAPWPRIIVLSGRGRERDVVRAFELGADDYMTKPFNPQELMARIARLLKADAPVARGASWDGRTG